MNEQRYQEMILKLIDCIINLQEEIEQLRAECSEFSSDASNKLEDLSCYISERIAYYPNALNTSTIYTIKSEFEDLIETK